MKTDLVLPESQEAESDKCRNLICTLKLDTVVEEKFLPVEAKMLELDLQARLKIVFR